MFIDLTPVLVSVSDASTEIREIGVDYVKWVQYEGVGF